MTYKLSRLRGKRGERVKHPVVTSGVTLDIDKNRMAMVFSGDRVFGELRVMEFEAHANGLFLRGYEPLLSGDERVLYQEWFLAYEGQGS